MPKWPSRSRRRSTSRAGADVSRYGLTGLLIAIVRAYRVAISPAFAPSCRFAPSCSAYAEEALTRYGARAGLVLAARRLARCHPWNDGGYDPVPAGEG